MISWIWCVVTFILGGGIGLLTEALFFGAKVSVNGKEGGDEDEGVYYPGKR